QANPNYHRARDTAIVPEFAADVARAVAAAAWVTAKATHSAVAPQFAAGSAELVEEEERMASREVDTGSFQRTTRSRMMATAADAPASRVLRFDAVKAVGELAGRAAFATAAVAGAPPPLGSLASRAVALVHAERAR